LKYLKIIPKVTLEECIDILEASLHLPQQKLDKKIKKLLKKLKYYNEHWNQTTSLRS